MNLHSLSAGGASSGMSQGDALMPELRTSPAATVRTVTLCGHDKPPSTTSLDVQASDFRMPNRKRKIDDRSLNTCAVCYEPLGNRLSILYPKCQHPFHIGCIATWAVHSSQKSYSSLREPFMVTCPTCRASEDFTANKSTSLFCEDIKELSDIYKVANQYKPLFDYVMSEVKKKSAEGADLHISGSSGFIRKEFWANLNGLEELSVFLDYSMARLRAILDRILETEVSSAVADRDPVDMSKLVDSLDELYAAIDHALPYEVRYSESGLVNGLLNDGGRRRVRISDLERLNGALFKKQKQIDYGTLLEFYYEHEASGFQPYGSTDVKKSNKGNQSADFKPHLKAKEVQ